MRLGEKDADGVDPVPCPRAASAFLGTLTESASAVPPYRLNTRSH